MVWLEWEGWVKESGAKERRRRHREGPEVEEEMKEEKVPLVFVVVPFQTRKLFRLKFRGVTERKIKTIYKKLSGPF